MDDTTAPDLVAADRLGRALAGATGQPAWHDLEAELISGGKSNLTFLLRSAAGDLVLRRPPTGELLPSAHDMLREARVQRALGPTGVPVPEILLVDERDLIGIQCYVMERVPGHVIRDSLPAGYATAEAERRTLSFGFVDTLARIHLLDIEEVGLADYGRPEGFMERQLRRWTTQWVKSRTHEVAAVEELSRRLAERVPVQRHTSLVHGDFRIDNCVFDFDDPGRVRAVLDWELSTLGDPLADVGNLMLFWRGPGEGPLSSLTPDVTHLPGFPSREEVIGRYAERTGWDLGDLDYYTAFAHFKFAVIVQGVSVRGRAGAMGGQEFGDLDDEIAALAIAGLDILRKTGQ